VLRFRIDIFAILNSMKKPGIKRLLELQKLLQEFVQVERVPKRQHNGTYAVENDVEHSYNLAMTAWFLAQWFPELDKDLVIKYALVHDLVEIYAGDTYAYASKAEIKAKHINEQKALKKLKKTWPDFAEMTNLIEDYETRSNAESRFVYALDKLMPIMLIFQNDGYTWKEKNITAKMLYDVKYKKVKLSPEVMPYFEQLHDLLLEHPEIIKPE
jgi:putative hydrolases of HD superfamily